ncbi:MAG: chorismate synthase [Candidatus Thorarchaeota archaeon]
MTFTFGKIFRIQVFGESHGNGVGVVIEGVPPGFPIDKSQIQRELDRRRPGSGELVSARSEMDNFSIRSGEFNGRATGGPIMMFIPNIDIDSTSYEEIKDTPRPGHADYTARMKYKGNNDYRGGGFFSGRITAAYVMAGAIAKQILQTLEIEVHAHTTQIGRVIVQKDISSEEIKNNVYTNPVRCADTDLVSEMELEIANAREDDDSVGGVIECRIIGAPVGLGEPIFDSVESVISHGMFSIPAIKGIEFGSGFEGSAKRGSENNDFPIIENGEVTWSKNDSGGILGGISNGAPIVFRVAIKPTPSIGREQKTVDLGTMKETIIQIKGRNDPSIVPRAVPVVESMAALVIVDLMMMNSTIINP